MNEVSEPLLRVRVRVCLVMGHVESSLSEEGLRVGRHVRQVVHHHEHLDHRPQRVEQRQLDGATLGDSIPFLSKIDMTLLIGEYYWQKYFAIVIIL